MKDTLKIFSQRRGLDRWSFLLPLIALGLVLYAVPKQASFSPAKYQLLGKIIGANFNSTSDQAIPINSTKYIVRRITCTNASTSLTLAVGGFYAAASKGTAIVANTQVYTALTGSTKYVDATLGALLGTDLRTEATLYLSLTIAQGGAATADCYIYGEDLSS